VTTLSYIKDLGAFGGAMIDTHAHRPAANAVAVNSYYYETDTGHIFQSNGTVWTDLGTGGLTASDVSGVEILANKNVANGYPGLDAGALIAAAELGTGAAGATTFLRGDRTWATPPASGAGQIPELYNNILGSDAANIDATGLNQGYTHLRVVGQARTDQSANNSSMLVTFNGDTAAHYDVIYSFWNGSAIVFNSGFAISNMPMDAPGTTADANRFGVFVIDILNYTAAVWKTLNIQNTSMSTATNAGSRFKLGGGVYRSTSAVTQVTLAPGGGTVLRAGSSLSVYGF
jgi:hypothetical protein